MATCTFNVPDLNASGDNLYGPRICNQAFVDWAWDEFNKRRVLDTTDEARLHWEGDEDA